MLDCAPAEREMKLDAIALTVNCRPSTDNCFRRKTINRREFLKSVGRKLTLGLLVGGTGALVLKESWMNLLAARSAPLPCSPRMRRKHEVFSEEHGRKETCVNNGICRGCPEVNSCGLPQALSIKQVVRK